MASHQLAIAKAALSASLLRPDPVSISRDEISTFHSLLEAALTRCSPPNIQLCKRWLLSHVTPSTARLKALGKYLVALSLSLGDKNKGLRSLTTEKTPSTRRKRLYVLYVLNDLFHHVRRDGQSGVAEEVVTSTLQPCLVQLLAAAASFENCPKHQEKVRVLLDIWEEKRYFDKEFIEELRGAVEDAKKNDGRASSLGETKATGLVQKDVTAGDAPFIMPSLHGDPTTPYYDLPAGNLMPHITSDGNHPINPQLVKPLQLAPGPADGQLVNAVKKFLQDVDRLFTGQGVGMEAGIFADIDELGQPLLRDEITGELSGGDTYYGWSRSFCEQMKARKRGRDSDGRRDDSRGRSITPQKRRRYSDSRSSSRGRWRSPSRSPPRFEHHRDSRSRRRSRSGSRSRFRSESPPDYSRRRDRGRSRTRSPDGSRSPPYSPRVRGPPMQQPPKTQNNGTAAHIPFQYPGGFPLPAAPPLQGHSMPDPTLLAQIMAQASMMIPGGIPVPPPPPALLPNGQWFQHPPPPPPPPPPQGYPPNTIFNPQGVIYPHHHPNMPVPPPPPPPPPYPSNTPAPQQQSYGGMSQAGSHSAGQWR
ncbi:MAG: kinase subunit of RNA polymerase II carboxy-terminal domain kinase I [Watsoniomyces obsoletus]|nr:MAG: kinase subunit of RNA polymerase II carboxy-terminal domain kinase I [Watsoniomyces obsoletus]